MINFGGARSITQKYFAKATNYYARNDPILLVNRRAMALMQQVLNQTDGEVIYLKHNTSFVFLQGRAGDALADHSLVGPTYLTALQREAAGEYYLRVLCSLLLPAFFHGGGDGHGTAGGRKPLFTYPHPTTHPLHHPHPHQNKQTVFRRAYYRAYWFEALKIAKPPEMGWGRYLRKRTAAATGFHNFFSNSTVARKLTDNTSFK